MTRTVITVARTLGSGGEQVGQIIARELGYRYADDEIIAEAAERAGVSRATVEKAEHKQGLITRILEGMGQVPLEPQIYYGQALAAVPLIESVPYDELIRDVIIGTAQQRNVVIVAHGAGMCLAGMDGLLRVLVTASDATRAARLEQVASIYTKRAEKAVKDSDKDREDFLKRFYNVGHESASNYDIVLNTDVLTMEQAAGVVLAGAKG